MLRKLEASLLAFFPPIQVLFDPAQNLLPTIAKTYLEQRAASTSFRIQECFSC